MKQLSKPYFIISIENEWRLYVHNFRCLENFDIGNMSSVLFIGKNGSGKSTIAYSLEILQKIGRGVNRARELIQPRDFSHGRSEVPINMKYHFSWVHW